MAVGTTRGKRRLGAFMRDVRVRAGLKPEQVAKLARCTRQTITRMESGSNLPRYHLFMAILEVIKPADSEHAKAVQLWDVADVTVVIENADELPAKYLRFRLDEGEAIAEWTWDGLIIPGMLQIPDYTIGLVRGQRLSDLDAESETRAVTDRRERQSLLVRQRNPLTLRSLIDESVLSRTVGGSDTMAAQLDHLLAITKMSNVTIQVVPLSHGAHAALGGSFLRLGYSSEDDPDEVYVESFIGAQNVGAEKDLEAASEVWAEIASKAPSPERSTEMIRAAREKI